MRISGSENEKRRSGVWGISRSAATRAIFRSLGLTTSHSVVGQNDHRAGKIVEGSRLVVAVRDDERTPGYRLRKRAFAAATGYSRLLFFDGISTDAIHLPLRDLRSIYGVRRNGAEMGLYRGRKTIDINQKNCVPRSILAKKRRCVFLHMAVFGKNLLKHGKNERRG